MIRQRALLQLFAFTLLAAPAAAEVGPKRASDIVHAFASGAECPLGIAGEAFDTRLLPSGGSAALQITGKRVLVVRRMDLGTSGGTPGAQLVVSALGGLSNAAASYAARSVTLDASGAARVQIEFPIGFVVPAGGSVCVSNSGGIDFGGYIEGYFAPAK
jgi:hypothetical protein